MTTFGSLLKIIIRPELWILACLLGALALAGSPRYRFWGRRLLLLGIVIFWGLGTRPVSEWLLRPLEFHHAPIAAENMPTLDLLVAVGAGTAWQPGSDSPTILSTSSLNHLVCGMALLRSGAAPVLLLAGGPSDEHQGTPAESEVMRDMAIRLGVPASAIVIEKQSRSTFERALAIRHILPHTNHIGLIDSAHHLPRATAAFQKQGFVVTSVPCDYRISSAPWSLGDFTPTLHGLGNTHLAIHEYIGIAFYWATGRL